MVQLVFVHGVSVRNDGPAYQAAVEERHTLLRSFAFKDTPITFYDPYWGQYGATARYNNAYIPQSPSTRLGIGGLAPHDSAPTSRSATLESAREDFIGTINTIGLLLVEQDPEEAALAAAIAQYALSLPSVPPAWLRDVTDDDEFYDRLSIEAKSHMTATTDATLGIGDALRKAGRRIAGGASNLVNGPIASAIRSLTPTIGTFIGDVFVYLKDGARRKRIRDVIASALVDAANKAMEGRERLVLIGHSMGGVILYDMLSDEQLISDIESQMRSRPFKADLLITIGSQPGLFEEYSLFESSASRKATRPEVVDHWWNIFDRVDVLSFAAEGIFDGVQDLEVDTIAGIVDAHSAYLRSQIVHHRLNARMKAAGLIT